MKNSDDKLIKHIRDSVAWVKSSREMEEEYMRFEELMQKEYQAGLEQGKAEGEK